MRPSKIYTKRMNTRELGREIQEIVPNLRNSDAVQVLQKGSQIAVMITQERFFQLLNYEATLHPQLGDLRPGPTEDEIAESIRETMEIMERP